MVVVVVMVAIVPLTVVLLVVVVVVFLVVGVVKFHNKARGRIAKKSVWMRVSSHGKKIPSTVGLDNSVNSHELFRIKTSGLTRIIQSYETVLLLLLGNNG